MVESSGMDLKQAAQFQYFRSSDFARVRYVMRAMFVFMGLMLGVALYASRADLVLATGIFGVFVACVLAVQAVVRREERSSSTFAAANAFSFVLMGGILFPTVPFFDENLAQTVVAMVSGLSMLAGVVGFCFGRFIFVLMFVRA